MSTSSTERSPALGRREFLFGTGLLLGSLALPLRSLRAQGGSGLPEATRAALESSPLVYISPLRAGGEESRCHGEVWFFADGRDVVIATGSKTWKVRALRAGLDRARLWVGDFGRARGSDGDFRRGPSFAARARFDTERAVFDRLLERYALKYPSEWGRWEPRFRSSYADGSRVLIRYAPDGA